MGLLPCFSPDALRRFLALRNHAAEAFRTCARLSICYSLHGRYFLCYLLWRDNTLREIREPGLHGIQGIGDGSKFLVDLNDIDRIETISTKESIEKSK